MHIQQAHIFVQLKVFDKYIFMLIRKLSHPSEIFAKVRTWSKLYSFRRKWRNSRFFENSSISSKIITHLFRLRICKRDSLRPQNGESNSEDPKIHFDTTQRVTLIRVIVFFPCLFLKILITNNFWNRKNSNSTHVSNNVHSHYQILFHLVP